ncbi:DUF3800 domain-containing protein [Dokdonella fugitiva]|jgi:hypothetical protein|uniref:DUF3800 domain-containing protein n=1 Tax=Dokdonella fugitiva TaxID=328517 RepID=UPI0015FA0570|nr:DUF3800 domain-containing protein [Dokdonella fugitiva]MBA8885805.1 hypothetical protein [Dokdonella fugitiva]
MQLFFADDSAQSSARKGMGKLVAFGGVLVPADRARALSQQIDSIAAAYSLPPGEEIKWSPRKGSWIHQNLQGEARTACYNAVLVAAAEHGCKAIVSVCDYQLRNLKPEWGFERCVQYALERVSTHLSAASEEAIIISDRPSGGHKEADRFLESFTEHLASQNNHMLEQTFAVNLLTAPSHMMRGLQVADLVVAITTAMFAGQTKWAATCFEPVKAMLIKNNFGYIGGTGAKVYPDSLINLYKWVLGEEHYSKVGAGTAWPLPNPKILFSSGDGT